MAVPRKRIPVVTKQEAVAIVRTALETVNASSTAHRLVVLDEEIGELRWAWVVPVQSAECARDRNPEQLLFGLGPYLVDKFTGEAIPTGTGARLHAIERARGYRAWWDLRGPNSMMAGVPKRGRA